MKHFFEQYQVVFVDTRFFCATSNLLFRHKIVFHATPNFCFGHRLECYVMEKHNHVLKKRKNIFMWHKKINFVFWASQIFYMFFTMHIGSMLIFFVVVLEIKKLLTHLLLTCLIYRSSFYIRAAPEKMRSYCLCFMFVKHLRRVNILVKLQASFPQILQTLTPEQVFFMDIT